MKERESFNEVVAKNRETLELYVPVVARVHGAHHPEIFDVQQLYLKPTLMQSLSISSLTVNRSQIIDVSNDRIVVKTPTVKDKADNKIISITDHSIPFDNPFRKPKPVSENIDRD